MLYLNEDFGKLKNVFPDFYEAMTVADFLENASSIKIPSKLRFLSPLSYCTADLRGRLSQWEILSYVDFHNVDIHIEEGRNYRISDITGEFSAGPPISAQRIELGTCVNPLHLTSGRYFEVSILYSPKNKVAYLEIAKKLGPPQEEQRNLEDLVAIET